MKTLKTTTYKGTVIRVGNYKRSLINSMIGLLLPIGYEEISIPIIQQEELFKDKVGEENNNLMFKFTDRKNRELCLAPEYTAVIMKLAQQDFKFQPDVKLFYVQECFRGERQQFGRWRQFTQLGLEVLNPKKVTIEDIAKIARDMLDLSGIEYEFNENVVRGLDYYKGGKGFEIRGRNGLQLCGGGEYEGGIGFAIGIDRLLV